MTLGISTLAALAVLAVTSHAYPLKEDDPFYFSRLHDINKDNIRSLDGVDTRDESRPLFSLITKMDQDVDAVKGPQPQYQLGSGSHLDGIGGGHLVRDLELEQGLETSGSVVVVMPDSFDVVDPESYGVVRLFPEYSKRFCDQRSRGLQNKEDFIRAFYGFRPNKNDSLDRAPTRCKSVKNDFRGSNRNPLLKIPQALGSPLSFSAFIKGLTAPGYKRSSSVDKLVKSYDQAILDSAEVKYSSNFEQCQRNINDLVALFVDKMSGNLDNSIEKRSSLFTSNYQQDHLDSLGGGHLIASKRDVGSMSEEAMIKRLDALGGGNLLAAKRDLDQLGGGHLLKRFNSEGGNNIMAGKKFLEQQIKSNLLRNVDSVRNFFAIKRDLDQLGGGHLLKRFNSEGWENPLPGNKYFEQKPNTNNFLGDFGSVGQQNILAVKRDLDQIGGGNLLKRFYSESGKNHLIRSYQGESKLL